MSIKNDVKTIHKCSLSAGQIGDSWPSASRVFLASKTDGQPRQFENNSCMITKLLTAYTAGLVIGVAITLVLVHAVLLN